jgi:hypothetical protein
MILSLCIFQAISLVVANDAKLNPVHAGTWATAGFFNGKDTISAEGNSGAIDKQPFTRLGGWVNLSGSISDHLEFSVVLAAMRWNSLPVTPQSSFTRNQLLSPGLGHAYLTYKIGEPEAPIATIKFGDMQYKYSPSKNLGGHLFNSGIYPGYLTSNFWNLVDGASYNAQGLDANFSFLGNSLNVNLIAFSEHDIYPQFNVSPGLLVSYKVGNIVEFGAGAVFSNLISVNDDKTTPKKRKNAYVNGAPLSKKEQGKLGLDIDTAYIVDDPADPRFGQQIPDSLWFYSLFEGTQARYLTTEENGIPNSQLSYYTFSGTKLMARINFTPLSPLGENVGRPAIYAEAVLLGYKDYPFYYEKKSERMPINLGIDIPTDKFEFNGEFTHYKNKFSNSIYNIYQEEIPIWSEDPSKFLKTVITQNPVSGKSDTSQVPISVHNNGAFYWSLTAKYKPQKNLVFSLKAVRDFIRPVNFFGNPVLTPAVEKKGSWYLLLQTDISI